MIDLPFQPLPQPLVVRVTDRFGNPVEGVAVRWQVRNGGGGVSPEEAATDAGGYAQTSWTPGFSFGRQRVWAVVDGLDGSPVEFEADIF